MIFGQVITAQSQNMAAKVKAEVLRIPKMWYFLRFGGFKPELSAVKVESNFNFFLSSAEVLQKKDTATIFKIYAPNRISVELTHIVPR